MELRHLRSFVSVAETLSFSLAAMRCFVTQSAISQHIKALEDKLGCKLFIRSSHEITLTESGAALLPRAKEILKQAEDCKEHINAINNCMKGELTIDLAFTMNTAYQDEGIETQPCIPFHIYAVMRNTHPLTRLPKVTYEDLLKHGVIMPDVGDRLFNTFQQYLQHDLTKLNVKCIVSDPDEDLAIVEQTPYITFMSKLYMKQHPTLAARPIVGLEHELMSNAHWMQDVPMKRSAQIFLDIIRQEVVPYITELEKLY